MIKLEEIPYSEKSYELQWVEAEMLLAIWKWENYEWLHKPLDEAKDD